jgi:hypothetical protein
MMISNRSRFFKPESETVFYCGLDLGQHKDYTAWCVVERRPGMIPEYHIRSLKRFALGTSYHQRVTFGTDLLRLMVCFNHSTQKQTLDYLCIQPEEIGDVYENEL